jgi:hypothetical protein
VITVVGGVYSERCTHPNWDYVYGSGGRAAIAIGTRTDAQLITAMSTALERDFLLAVGDARVQPVGVPTDRSVTFDYFHPLSDPSIHVSGNSRDSEKPILETRSTASLLPVRNVRRGDRLPRRQGRFRSPIRGSANSL